MESILHTIKDMSHNHENIIKTHKGYIDVTIPKSYSSLPIITNIKQMNIQTITNYLYDVLDDSIHICSINGLKLNHAMYYCNYCNVNIEHYCYCHDCNFSMCTVCSLKFHNNKHHITQRDEEIQTYCDNCENDIITEQYYNNGYNDICIECRETPVGQNIIKEKKCQ